MVLSVNSTGFIVGVFLIALFCWYLRSRIESDPEPFFLGLTFFAFAGQFIRTAEWTSQLIVKGRAFPGYGKILILLGLGLATVIGQAFVMKTHMQLTTAHYAQLLKRNHLKGAQDHQIERWITVLLRITGVDFFPGGYRWLKDFFPTSIEPREKSRRLAVSVLPSKEFRIDPESAITQQAEGTTIQSTGIAASTLVVPPSLQRSVYWWSYVVLCILSWIWFISVMMVPLEHS